MTMINGPFALGDESCSKEAVDKGSLPGADGGGRSGRAGLGSSCGRDVACGEASGGDGSGGFGLGGGGGELDDGDVSGGDGGRGDEGGEGDGGDGKGGVGGETSSTIGA